MNSPVRIIFFDIDGTLSNSRTKQVSPLTFQALHALQDKGIRICVSSGRAPMTLPTTLDPVHFDAYITFNGGYCFSGNDIIYHNPIDHNDVLRIIHNAGKIHRPVVIATKNRLAANGSDDPDLVEYFELANLKVIPAADFDEAARQKVYQIMMGGRPDEYPDILNGVQGARITAWWKRAVDIIPADCSKAVGVQRVLDYFHLSRENAMAFGDGDNDVEMLEAVGTGVAMGNSLDSVKQKADDVCLSVEQDGIYHYLKDHQLI